MRLEDYTADAICQSMGLRFIEHSWAQAETPTLRVVLTPSFHPELCITLSRTADAVRLSVVADLAGGTERGSSEFNCGIANSTLSHHLKVLRLAGVINHRKEGTRCFVTLRPELEKTFPGLLTSILKFGKRT